MLARSIPAKAFALFASFVLAFSLLGTAIAPRSAEAQTWAEYLAERWQDCEDTFAGLDRSTGLKQWDGSQAQPTQGTGTAADPYKVSTPEQLAWVMNTAPAANRSFQLQNDLDMGGLNKVKWTPSNQGGITDKVVMDGNGHTIYNLYINAASGNWSQPGLGFISHVDNPNFTLKDVTFKFGEVRATGGSENFTVCCGHLVRGTLDGVSVQDSLVKGGNFTAGLAVGWNTGYTATTDGVTWNEATTGSYINNCSTERVYTYGASCTGNFTAPIYGSKVTNSYAVEGVTISTGGHSGGFVSCPGYVYAENNYCNITMYGNTATAVFAGVSHYKNVFKKCYSSGVVEGTNMVGGFVGNATDAAEAALFEDCYSTTMVGMQSTASNMGGFAGVSNGNHTFRNCYSAGEVGALTTAGTNLNSVGGFVGFPASGSWSKFENCSYDLQTSAIASPSGLSYPIPAANGSITALQTKQATGDKALQAMHLDSAVWEASAGVYPQLKAFSQPASDLFRNQAERDRGLAFSMASVCTAMLYPSNGDYTEENGKCDTVRSIRYLFPLTNNAMVGDSRFDVSWKADELYSELVGNHDIPIITLNPNSYEVASLAPGVGWCTVSVGYKGADGDVYTGTRRLRLVPTTTLSVATAAGVDHTAYVQAGHEGVRPIPQKAVDDGLTTYDHRNGVNFSLGDAVQLAGGQIKTEAFPPTEEAFTDVVLPDTIGGIVDVVVDRQIDGEWVKQDLSDPALQSLLLKKRDAEKSDLGQYRITYKWYTSGNKQGASLESVKYLSVIETFAVTYLKNTEALEAPAGATVKTLADAGSAAGEVHYFDPGAYVPGNTVDAAYYPGHPSSSVKNPETPGYTFVGWATTPDAAAPDFDQTTQLSGDTTVYALWQRADHKVTFDAGEGQFLPKEPEEGEDPDPDAKPTPTVEQEYKALDKVTPPATNPVRDGYSFMGWATTPDATTPDFDPEAQVWDDDATFHAVWKKNPTPSMKSEVVNLTDPESPTLQVGDQLKNIITVTNEGDPDSLWKDVKVTDPLPEGVTLDPDSIVLRAPDGTETKLDPKDVYDPETRTLTIPVGDIDGGDSYVVVFETTVNGSALEEDGKDLTNTPQAGGSNPDGTPLDPLDESSVPVGGDATLPDDPVMKVDKTVSNTTRSDEEDAVVGDVLAYTITVTNDQPDSLLKGGVLSDPLPQGITLDESSLELVGLDGVTSKLPAADVYDPETRTITVPLAELAYGQSIKVTFKATVNDLAADPDKPECHDIGNKAFAEGTTPEDKVAEDAASKKTYPTGWIKFATPDPNVKKTVANDTREHGFYQGDTITYTIRAANDMPATHWNDVRITDTLPEGLDLDLSSIRLIHADGTVETLMSYSYQPETRTLVANIDHIDGGEAWEIKYTCTLHKPDNDDPIVNNVTATGSTPDQDISIDGFSFVSIDSPAPAPNDDSEGDGGNGTGGNGTDDGDGNGSGNGGANGNGAGGIHDGTSDGQGLGDAQGEGAGLAKTADASAAGVAGACIAAALAAAVLLLVRRMARSRR